MMKRKSRQIPLFHHDHGIWVDLFAGAGGASAGVAAALGREVDVAINHSAMALAVHCRNHPQTLHLTADIYDVDPLEATRGRRVLGIWASPDCTFHSVAKGGKPRDHKNRSLADVIPKWLAATRASILAMENVPEFEGWGPLDEHGMPIKARKGEIFLAWKQKIVDLGYVVEHRVLDCSLYGAPTRRRRFFLIARCDGQPIVWPEPTHGPGRLPLHTAAECIDWSLPSQSIFGRKKPLAEKTMWRIAQGLRKYVFESARPFIVKVNHGKRDPRGESIDEPLSTITAARRGHALVAPTLIQTGYGERKGQAARTLDIKKPLGTIVACGQKHALVSAWIAKYYGNPLRADKAGSVVFGQDLERPLGTITTRDHHSLACVSLDEPEEGSRVAEVRAFLTAYYKTGTGQELTEPLRTITTKHRLGLVTVEGAEYQVCDISLRMLQPHELLRAQFGRFAKDYDLSDAKTLADKVLLIGNSVPPEMAEALIAANIGRDAVRAA